MAAALDALVVFTDHCAVLLLTEQAHAGALVDALPCQAWPQLSAARRLQAACPLTIWTPGYL